MSRTVFICDDSDGDVGLLLQAFTTAGFSPDIIRARDGAEAIRFLETDPVLDLVILDQRVPLHSGQEVAQHLASRGHFPRCPVIVMTSQVGKGREQLQALGIHTILEKPFSLEGYLEVGSSLANLVASGNDL
jgi:CheY-like chemotaxis protein